MTTMPPLSLFRRAAAIESKARLSTSRPASHPWRLVIRDKHGMNPCRLVDLDVQPDQRTITQERRNAAFAWFCRSHEIEHEVLAPA